MERGSKAEEKTITRRDFVKGTVYGTLGLTFGLKGLGSRSDILNKTLSNGLEKPLAQSKVTLIRDSRAVGNNHELNAEIMYEMINTAVKIFFAGNVSEPWHIHISPVDMLMSDNNYPKSKKTSANQKIIYSVIMPFERYKDIIDDGGAELDKALLKANSVKEKKLFIVDALHPRKTYKQYYKGILVGDDPLAVAALCHEINHGHGWPVRLGIERIAFTVDMEYKKQAGKLPEIKAIRSDRVRQWLS